MNETGSLNEALQNNRIEIVGFYSPRKSHAWGIKKKKRKGKWGKSRYKAWKISQYSILPAIDVTLRTRSNVEATCGSCIHTNSTFSGCFPGSVCVCVCVYARLLLSLHHDFEYAWLDVLPRRCCSKNSTVIFDFRRGEKIFYFFSTDSSSRWCTTWTSRRTDERKREVVQHRSRSIRRSPAWHNFEFYATCSDSSNNVLMDPRKSFNPLIFVSWKICKVWEDTVQTRKSISPFDVFYGKRSDNIIVRVHLWFRRRR